MRSSKSPRCWPLLLVAVLASAQSRAETPPKFPSGVELVRLDVVVVDRDGRPVEGLTAGDFSIEENGRPRAVRSFEPIVVQVRTPAAPSADSRPTLAAAPQTHVAEEGRCVLIFVDDVHLAASTAQQLRLQLVPFVERELRDGDWVMLVAPHAHVRWTARTAWERAQIPSVLGRIGGQYSRDPFQGHVAEFEAMEAVERHPTGPHGGSLGGGDRIGGQYLLFEEVYAVARRRIGMTLSALRDAVASLASVRGHKSLILYSQGFVLAPRFPELDEIVDLARRANVAVHFVDPRGLASTCAESGADPSDCDNSLPGWMKSSAGAISIAQATGGRDSRLNDPVAEVRRVLEESQAYYLIGYEPVDARPGERRVQVRVPKDGLKVLARKRYVVVKHEASKTRVAPEIAVLHSISDATDLPIRAGVVAPAAEADSTAVAFSFEIPASTAPGRRRFSLLLEARPRDSGDPVLDQAEVTLEQADRPAHFERRLKLSPGVWQARAVLRDVATGRLGSVLLTFEVPVR